MDFNSIATLLTAIVSALLGIFVFFAGKRNTSSITLTLLAFAMAGWCFGQFMGAVLFDKEMVLLWTRINIVFAILISPLFFHFVLVFTDRADKNKWLLAGIYFLAIILIGFDFTRYFVADVAPLPQLKYYPVAGKIYPFFWIYLGGVFLAGVGYLMEYVRRVEKQKENQAKYVLAASLIGFLGGMTAFFPVFHINLPIMSHYFMPICLAMIILAIVKHKLLDIDVIIFQGLVYSALTIIFTGFYVLAILLMSRIFQNITGYNNLFLMALAVFVSVLIFQPMREIIQRWIDTLFFRGKYYYQKKMGELSSENLKLYSRLLEAEKFSALGTLAAGMAHEIKNPLASIKGMTQVLPENIDEPGFLDKYSEIVCRQLDRINKIVEDLLVFGQPRKIEVEDTDLIKILDEVLRLIESQCAKSNIVVIKEYQNVPKIKADSEKLTQAFLNVLLNAVQAMERGGVIKLGVRSEDLPAGRQGLGDGIQIEITDTGTGIAKENISKLFDPFYTTKEKGTGMGLAVTYSIIKEHEGEITILSETGKGSTFKICLPIRPKHSV
ncbi:MAG: ATP-binding protein [Candidatus Margulisiibacteriota bacterium]